MTSRWPAISKLGWPAICSILLIMANAPEPALPGLPAAFVGVWALHEAGCLLPGEAVGARAAGFLIVSRDGYDGDGTSCRLAGSPLAHLFDDDAHRTLSFACGGEAAQRSEVWQQEIRTFRIAGWDIHQPELVRDGRHYRKCALEAKVARKA